MAHQLNRLADKETLASALADRVSAALAEGIAARGKASIAVSGGSTPKAFFKALSTRSLDWSCVTVTLVDERFVPPHSERSNHALVRDNLLQNAAAAAEFVPLYHAGGDAAHSAALASEAVAAIGYPFDVAILGMGNDGHTASFFPGGDRLAEALSMKTPRGVVTMEAEGAGETRLTLTFSALQDARLLVLHIEGQQKMDVLEQALAGGDEHGPFPIGIVLENVPGTVEIFWAP